MGREGAGQLPVCAGQLGVCAVRKVDEEWVLGRTD